MGEQDKRVVDFATILQLEKMVRSSRNLSELAFIIMNETHKLVGYKNAFLWFANSRGGVDVFSASGVEEVDKSAPLVHWLKKAIASFAVKKEAKSSQVIGIDHFPKVITTDWSKYMSRNVFWCPLLDDDGNLYGGIWFAKDKPYQKNELVLLEIILDAYRHQIGVYKEVNKNKGNSLLKKLSLRGLLIAVVILMFLPVRQSVVATSSIVPKNPVIVNSPINGVIKKVLVEPNNFIGEGDNLIVFDDVEMKNRYEVSLKTLKVVEAELKKARQLAFSSPQDQANIKLLEAKLEQKVKDVEYNKTILSKVLLQSSANGVAIFGDKNDLIGRPVVVGEKLLVIANPREVELEIMVPAEDAISLEKDSKVDFFLNINAMKSYRAKIYQASYEPIITPEGVASYKVKATILADRDLPRVGLKAVSKIYGKNVSVFYYLFRRPIRFIRQKLGL